MNGLIYLWFVIVKYMQIAFILLHRIYSTVPITMRPNQLSSTARFAAGALLSFCLLGIAHAGTATNITGLYTTGATGNNRDTNWDISTSTRGAYVVSNNIPVDWVADTPTAQWVSYAANPSLANSTYAYTLSFNISGTGTGPVNNVAITLTLAVDDASTIYVNNGNTKLTASGWTKTTTLTLNSSNSNFVIGTNTITIYVANSGSGATGLLVASIGGVVPEVGAWMPVLGALAVVGWIRFRPKKSPQSAAI